jgi:hypothetical protein
MGRASRRREEERRNSYRHLLGNAEVKQLEDQANVGGWF